MAISAFVWAIIAVVVSTAVSVGMALQQKKAMEDAQAGLLIQKQGGTHPIPIIYGKRRIAPVKVWQDISKTRHQITSVAAVADSGFTHNREFDYKNSRPDKDFLHRIDVWCQGPITSIGAYEVDNDPTTHRRFSQSDNLRPIFRALNKHGSDNQTMFSLLSSGFSGVSTDMRGNGLAWSWNSFFYTTEKPAYTGDPQITALIEGLACWDPRANPEDPTIKSYSNNPALILLDYLTAPYGKGLSVADVDIASIMSAADVCDVVVSLPTQPVYEGPQEVYEYATGEYISVPTGNPNPNGNTLTSQKRFTCNLALMPDVDSKENVAEILKTFKGSLPFINGKYVLSMEIAANSVMAFDETNIIDGVTISYADRSKRLNQVTVKFPNSLKGHKEDAVTWPKSTSDMYTLLVAEDSGEKLTTEAKLSGVTSYSQAEDLAEFMVRDSRNQQIITFKSQPVAMQLEPNDIITVTTDALNYDAKEYRVREVKLGSDLTVQIVAQEYDPTVYPWYDGEPEPAPEYIASTLFDEPNAVEGLLLSANSSINTDGTAATSIDVAWDEIETGTSTVSTIQIGHKLAAGSNYSWAVILSGSENAYNIPSITDGQTYDVAIRYQNMVGMSSPDTTASIAIGAVSTVVNTLSNTGAQTTIDLEAVIESAQNQDDTLNTISETLLDLALTAGDTLEKINDAGILVSPDDGTVVISALESLRDETSLTSTNLGIRLDAAEGSIVLKATQSFVNDAIAAATLPEATLESLEELQLQVNNVEIDLNAAEGAISLKADTLTLDQLRLEYDQTFIDVDAVEAAILLKAESSDFDDLTGRVSTAEIELEAVDAPSIALTVRDVSNLYEEMDLNDIGTLEDLLDAYRGREAIKTDLALTTISLHAEVNDRREALSTARTELQTKIDNNTSSIVSEQTARASETSALARDVTTLTATVGEDRASVNSYQEATVDAIEGLQAKQGVALDVNGYITGYEQFNDGQTSGFTISSDSFKVVDPDGGANQSGTQVFSIANSVVSLGDDVELHADRITAGILNAERITLNGRDITELNNDADYQTGLEVQGTINEIDFNTYAVTTYLHIAYADDAVGTNFNSLPAGRSFIGTYSDTNSDASGNHEHYVWSQYVGENGIGIPGTSSYLHIAYADDADGTRFHIDLIEDRVFIGTYTDSNLADSVNHADYTWAKFIGTNGTPGADAGRTAKGIIYWQTAQVDAPTQAAISAYNFGTGVPTIDTTGWGLAPLTIDEGGGTYWAASYQAIEAVLNGSVDITVTAAYKTHQMDGLVTFTNLAADLASLGGNITTINGGNITTGIINADLIEVGTLRADRLILDGNFLEVDDNGVLRIAQAYQEATAPQPTQVTNATGNIAEATPLPSITVTTLTGGKVAIGIDWSLSRKFGGSVPTIVGNPFPVTVSLKRGGATIKNWVIDVGSGGTYHPYIVELGEPDFAVGTLNVNYLDVAGSSTDVTYSVDVTSLLATKFNLALQLTGQAVV